MTETDPVPTPPDGRPRDTHGQARQAHSPRRPSTKPSEPPPGQPVSQADPAAAGEIADAVLDRIGDKVADGRKATDSRPPQTDIVSVEQAITLREQAPEMYDLWLKIAKDRAATANYVDRAPYEVPERLAQSGRPRALGALIIVLSFCGYLAWLGGPGPYIGGLIAILDLGVMFGMFFGLRPERLPDPQETERRPPPRRRLTPGHASASAGWPSVAAIGRPHRTICAGPADEPDVPASAEVTGARWPAAGGCTRARREAANAVGRLAELGRYLWRRCPHLPALRRRRGAGACRPG